MSTDHKQAFAAPSAPGRFITVLVVDDDPAVSQTIARTLTKHFAVRVLQADNGLAALELLDGNAVDLVVLDFEMPLMSGIDVLTTIRRSSRYANLPVMMATGNAEEELVCRLIELGIVDYLVKPLTPTMLQQRIAPIIERVSRSAGGSSRTLNLTSSSQILIVDEDEPTRRAFADLLAFARRVDDIGMGTAALRQCVTTAYDAVIIGRVGGVVDSLTLAEKLRVSPRVRSAHLIGIVDQDDDPKAESRLFDAVLTRTNDSAQAFRQLSAQLTPAGTARLLLVPASPHVDALFTNVQELLKNILRAEISMHTTSPVFVRDQQRWAAARVEARSKDLAWHVRLVCPHSLALAIASAERGLTTERVSEAGVQQSMCANVCAIAESVRTGFDRHQLDFRLGEAAFYLSSSPQADADLDVSRGASRWFAVESERSGALVQLLPRKRS